MKWRGRVYQYIQEEISKGCVIHCTLIDPERVNSIEDLRKSSKMLQEAGTSMFLVGGSLLVTERDVDEIIHVLENEVTVPIVLFPGSVAGLSRYADAVLFLSLLNSDDPYFIVGAQVYAAPIIKRYGLEVLPTAYLIVGYGGAAGFMGRARPIPIDKPEIAAAYALAAKYMGMKFVYLEAGSGAPSPIPPSFVTYVRRIVGDDMILIVGGGIRSPSQAVELAKAGANMIVTGTIVEKDLGKALEIAKALKSMCRKS